MLSKTMYIIGKELYRTIICWSSTSNVSGITDNGD